MSPSLVLASNGHKSCSRQLSLFHILSLSSLTLILVHVLLLQIRSPLIQIEALSSYIASVHNNTLIDAAIFLCVFVVTLRI